MPQCEYEYRPDDRPVLLKKKKAGDICGTSFGRKELYYVKRLERDMCLCPMHAKIEGVHSLEDDRKRYEKSRTSNKKTVAALKNAEKEKFKYKIEAAERKWSIELVHNILQDRNFNLGEMYNELVLGGLDSTSGSLVQKRNLFALWWISDPLTRHPASLREVARILGITQKQVMEWYQSETFGAALDRQRKIRIKLLMPFVDIVQVQKALLNDTTAAKYLRDIEGELRKDDTGVDGHLFEADLGLDGKEDNLSDDDKDIYKALLDNDVEQ